jgi:hypothetical protein
MFPKKLLCDFFSRISLRDFFFVVGETGGCWTPTVNLLLIYKIDKKSTNTKKLRKKIKIILIKAGENSKRARYPF